MADEPSKFTPRSLGISAPEGKDVHEVYLKVRSRPSVLGKISNALGSRNIDILGAHAQVSDDKQTADLIFYVEMGASTAPISEVVGDLRRQDFVIEARSEPRKEVYFEAFTFPLTSGGHHRVFVLDGRGWVALVRSFLQKFGSAGRTILHDEGVAFGRELIDRTGGRFRSPPEPALLLSNLKALFRASGLGILEVVEEQEGGRFAVSIAEPAVSLGGDKDLTDDFLVGVVRGAMERTYGRGYRVENLARRNGTMTFELTVA